MVRFDTNCRDTNAHFDRSFRETGSPCLTLSHSFESFSTRRCFSQQENYRRKFLVFAYKEIKQNCRKNVSHRRLTIQFLDVLDTRYDGR